MYSETITNNMDMEAVQNITLYARKSIELKDCSHTAGHIEAIETPLLTLNNTQLTASDAIFLFSKEILNYNSTVNAPHIYIPVDCIQDIVDGALIGQFHIMTDSELSNTYLTYIN